MAKIADGKVASLSGISVTNSGIRLVEGYMNEAEQPNPGMEQKCPQCGTPLPYGVLAGLCPACLMKQGAAADTGVAWRQRRPHRSSRRAWRRWPNYFPQLEIIALLGKGGMGAVYKARQPALDRIVALKILPREQRTDRLCGAV